MWEGAVQTLLSFVLSWPFTDQPLMGITTNFTDLILSNYAFKWIELHSIHLIRHSERHRGQSCVGQSRPCIWSFQQSFACGESFTLLKVWQWVHFRDIILNEVDKLRPAVLLHVLDIKLHKYCHFQTIRNYKHCILTMKNNSNSKNTWNILNLAHVSALCSGNIDCKWQDML